MKPDEFTKEKNALITKISEKPKSMFGLSWQLWREILIGQYIFDRDDRLVEVLKKVKHSDILSLYRVRTVCNSNTLCLLLADHFHL